METPRLPELTIHEIGKELKFLSAVLPPYLAWDATLFADVWNRHPTDKRMIRTPGGLKAAPRYQQEYVRDYHYPGGEGKKALSLPPDIGPLYDWVRGVIDARLDGVLLNWYDGPGHHIGPHNDETRGLVPDTPIVTVSLGETRVFRLSHGPAGSGVHDFPAPNGTVFVMPWATNLAWKHSVPKSTRYTGRRISVTFRAFDAG